MCSLTQPPRLASIGDTHSLLNCQEPRIMSTIDLAQQQITWFPSNYILFYSAYTQTVFHLSKETLVFIRQSLSRVAQYKPWRWSRCYIFVYVLNMNSELLSVPLLRSLVFDILDIKPHCCCLQPATAVLQDSWGLISQPHSRSIYQIYTTINKYSKPFQALALLLSLLPILVLWRQFHWLGVILTGLGRISWDANLNIALPTTTSRNSEAYSYIYGHTASYCMSLVHRSWVLQLFPSLSHGTAWVSCRSIPNPSRHVQEQQTQNLRN